MPIAGAARPHGSPVFAYLLVAPQPRLDSLRRHVGALIRVGRHAFGLEHDAGIEMNHAFGVEAESVFAERDMAGIAAAEIFLRRLVNARVNVTAQRGPDIDVLA